MLLALIGLSISGFTFLVAVVLAHRTDKAERELSRKRDAFAMQIRRVKGRLATARREAIAAQKLAKKQLEADCEAQREKIRCEERDKLAMAWRVLAKQTQSQVAQIAEQRQAQIQFIRREEQSKLDAERQALLLRVQQEEARLEAEFRAGQVKLCAERQAFLLEMKQERAALTAAREQVMAEQEQVAQAKRLLCFVAAERTMVWEGALKQLDSLEKQQAERYLQVIRSRGEKAR